MPARDAKTPTETKKLRKIGKSHGLTLSKKMLEASGLTAGEEVVVTAEQGKIIVSQGWGITARTREAGRACKEQYRWALEMLGKETFSQ